jgi:hypothetical protein
MPDIPAPEETSQKKEPETEHEWTIHSLNIHGLFFQRKCEAVVRNQGGWKVEMTEYPVEYPPYGTGPTAESALDIYAEHNVAKCRLTLLIECKKANPEFVDWIFFVKQGEPSPIRYTKIDIDSAAPGTALWWSKLLSSTEGLSGLLANEARESRGSYVRRKGNDRTKTSNAAITEAARQVALATQAIKYERINFLRRISHPVPQPPQPFKRQVFLPVIVTTARLFACDFNPAAVSIDDGEIPWDKVTLTPQKWLYYEYPMSRALQLLPDNAIDPDVLLSQDPQRLTNIFGRMHILVVQGRALSELLTHLVAARDHLMALA